MALYLLLQMKVGIDHCCDYFSPNQSGLKSSDIFVMIEMIHTNFCHTSKDTTLMWLDMNLSD